MYIDFYNALQRYVFWDFYTQYYQKMRFLPIRYYNTKRTYFYTNNILKTLLIFVKIKIHNLTPSTPKVIFAKTRNPLLTLVHSVFATTAAF